MILILDLYQLKDHQVLENLIQYLIAFNSILSNKYTDTIRQKEALDVVEDKIDETLEKYDQMKILKTNT